MWVCAFALKIDSWGGIGNAEPQNRYGCIILKLQFCLMVSNIKTFFFYSNLYYRAEYKIDTGF
jgi:hypothetical protein